MVYARRCPLPAGATEVDDSATLIAKWRGEPVENGMSINLDNCFDVSAPFSVVALEQTARALGSAAI